MPQIFQVLKCYKCFIFQVHLTKKSNKWECKLCGEKQSNKRYYGLGTAQECRAHVQKLNAMQGDKIESSLIKNIDSEDDDYIHTSKEELKQSDTNTKIERKSKWAAFIEENEDIPNNSNDPEYNEAEVLLELPKKQKLTHKQTSNSDEYTKANYLNKKICYQKDDQIKQCNKNFTRQNKWSAYTSENENVPNFTEPINHKDDVSLEITPKTNRRFGRKEELEFDCKQVTKRTHTNLNTNYMKSMENTKDICFERNIFKKFAKIEDTVVSENTKLPTVAVCSTEQGSKWSQFVDTENANDYNSDGKESHIQNGNKYLFSLCDDNDLDSILEV